MKSGIVLLSGGLDSATTLWMVKDKYDILAVSFDYGQTHKIELVRSKILAEKAGVNHLILKLNLDVFGGSTLLGDDKGVNRLLPSSYVPARNTILLSYALALVEVTGSKNVFIGANESDYTGYPDCREKYFHLISEVFNQITDVRIHRPLIDLTKPEIIKKGLSLGLDYGLTTTCYNPVGGNPCKKCDACKIRIQAFKLLNLEDPLVLKEKDKNNE